MGNGEIRPITELIKPRHWLIWNFEYMITSGRYVPISTSVKKSVQRGLLGRVVKYNIITFIFFSRHRLQVRPVDRCSRAVAQKRGITQRCAFWGLEHSIFTSPPWKTRKKIWGTYNAKPTVNTYSHNCTIDRATMLKFWQTVWSCQVLQVFWSTHKSSSIRGVAGG